MSAAQVAAIRAALPACPSGYVTAKALFITSSNGRRSIERRPAVARQGVWSMITGDGQQRELAEHHPIPDALLFLDGSVEAFGRRRFLDLAAFCRACGIDPRQEGLR